MADPAGSAASSRKPRSNLVVRILAALVLAPLALAAAIVGGWPFKIFWGAAALAIVYEWVSLVAIRYGRASPLALAGLLYAGGLLAAVLILRGDPQFGLTAILLLFAVVWPTDIGGYFVGRFVGGPKLMPTVSPSKTWSGAAGGTLAAIACALLVAVGAGLTNLVAIAVLAVVLSIVAQAGDLFESFVKRRFSAKDASNLIPGHGGVMDRLDGFLTASIAAALIGLARGGFDAPARGLLQW